MIGATSGAANSAAQAMPYGNVGCRSTCDAASVDWGRPWRRLLHLPRFFKSTNGNTAVEFAMVAPVFFLIVVGTFELALYLFLSGSVQSAVMVASRYGITGQQAGLLDRQIKITDIVEERTWDLVTIKPEDIETLVYENFGDIGESEPYSDTNGNGSFDDGSETFTDVNGNGLWDQDMGAAGLGGPGDIVLYKIAFTTDVLTNVIQPIFGDKFHYTASVAVRNEPY
ncbi:MAG: TadE/TadG family type IV pilus assembly protein [Pseudomonadota bacterium]